jgi:hypothetical protein
MNFPSSQIPETLSNDNEKTPSSLTIPKVFCKFCSKRYETFSGTRNILSFSKQIL